MTNATSPAPAANPFWNDMTRHIAGQVIGGALTGAIAGFGKADPAVMVWLGPAIMAGSAYVSEKINQIFG